MSARPDPLRADRDTPMMTMTRHLEALSDEEYDRLMAAAREVLFPADTRVFEQGGTADRFWILRDGTVELRSRIPGSPDVAVEELGQGSLLGWSWQFPPYHWHLAAVATSDVRAWEFDAETVRRMCREDTRFGYLFTLACAEVIGHHLVDTRRRLLDLFGPHGGEERE